MGKKLVRPDSAKKSSSSSCSSKKSSFKSSRGSSAKTQIEVGHVGDLDNVQNDVEDDKETEETSDNDQWDDVLDENMKTGSGTRIPESSGSPVEYVPPSFRGLFTPGTINQEKKKEDEVRTVHESNSGEVKNGDGLENDCQKKDPSPSGNEQGSLTSKHGSPKNGFEATKDHLPVKDIDHNDQRPHKSGYQCPRNNKEAATVTRRQSDEIQERSEERRSSKNPSGRSTPRNRVESESRRGSSASSTNSDSNTSSNNTSKRRSSNGKPPLSLNIQNEKSADGRKASSRKSSANEFASGTKGSDERNEESKIGSRKGSTSSENEFPSGTRGSDERQEGKQSGSSSHGRSLASSRPSSAGSGVGMDKLKAALKKAIGHRRPSGSRGSTPRNEEKSANASRTSSRHSSTSNRTRPVSASSEKRSPRATSVVEEEILGTSVEVNIKAEAKQPHDNAGREEGEVRTFRINALHSSFYYVLIYIFFSLGL